MTITSVDGGLKVNIRGHFGLEVFEEGASRNRLEAAADGPGGRSWEPAVGPRPWRTTH